MHLTKNAKKLFIIPKELGKDDVKIISIGAGSFTYSPNKQWIAFVVSPTASWSMDSDMLCVISVDGKNFEVIDELNQESILKWAFTENLLGYIAGGGRIVFGFKNKDLKVTELPANQTVTLTPKNYAEMGFSWVDNASLIVSRVPETEWSDDANKRPKPLISIITNRPKTNTNNKASKRPRGFYTHFFTFHK